MDSLESTTVLGLKLPTDPRWANAAEMDIKEILNDHAWCEQKAASTCITIIVHYSDYQYIVEAVAPVITEEWGHFRLVLRELKKRGFELGPQRKDIYVNEVVKFQIKGGHKSIQLVDKLLTSALIEARSCERFKILSKEISDESLKRFYHDLMVAEAGHYRLFLDLAYQTLPDNGEYVKNRWREFLEEERRILLTLEPNPRRMH